MMVALPALAQEGHPLKGSWLGTWAGNKIHGNDVLLVMTWDGKNITGTINPGTDNMAIKNASLNPDGVAFNDTVVLMVWIGLAAVAGFLLGRRRARGK